LFPLPRDDQDFDFDSPDGFQSKWLDLDRFKEPGTKLPFFMQTPDGIFCRMCHQYHGHDNSKDIPFATTPAKCSRLETLDKHISSDKHKAAVEAIAENSQSSVVRAFSTLPLNYRERLTIRLRMAYFLCKHQIANRQMGSLNKLLLAVSIDKRRLDFGYLSSDSVSEFIGFIADHIRERLLTSITKAGMWSAMVDEATDITTTSQYR
jgi:hypothetical protein